MLGMSALFLKSLMNVSRVDLGLKIDHVATFEIVPERTGYDSVRSAVLFDRVEQELAFAVANAASTCNQLRMDLGATDARILQMPVHFDMEVAGFDSRDGTTPKTRPVLCAAGNVLRGRPSADAVMRALNDVVTALASPPAR